VIPRPALSYRGCRLWLLWRARDEISGTGADRRLLGAVLLGFAVWQAVDVVLFHWILVIHRIRVGVPNPLFWDLAWLIVIGGPPLAMGLRRRAGREALAARRAAIRRAAADGGARRRLPCSPFRSSSPARWRRCLRRA
jgi:hypothetical protein